jgi:two-component system nitrogen regulation response regulator NtrX
VKSSDITIVTELLEAPIFGSSPAMRRVLDQVIRAAKTRSHVLISGEPGTGRELVAREIHRRTETTDGPFVRVACTADSPDDFEFDLFGHSSQAPGRPDRRTAERIGRAGHLYQAIGGTIFFTNLPEIAMPVQARLARLLRESEAVVLNGKNKVNLAMRVIAAVEQGYDQQARDARIHQDLFDLLVATRLDLPPLRRRSEDIPGLASFLLGETCRQNGVASKELSNAAQQLLCALPWHGNATELQRLLTELVNRVHGDIIDLTDVLATVQIDARAKPFTRGGTLREARARFEREYIAAVVAQHHGRIPEAAKTLGVQRPNLYRKLRRLNVPTTSKRNNVR